MSLTNCKVRLKIEHTLYGTAAKPPAAVPIVVEIVTAHAVNVVV